MKYEPPKAEAYCDLRRVAGMSEKSVAAARKGLGNACFDVTLYDNVKLIGMGRLIGDGGTAFQIIDIAVDPEYQGQGYGKKIMTEIMNYLNQIAEAGTYVSLIADYPADQLYKQFGFEATEPEAGGMYRRYT
ncbi:GNAT family N-acetyltransferase [Staphylococcus marylandisciuri]